MSIYHPLTWRNQLGTKDKKQGLFHILLDGGHGSSGKGAAVCRLAELLKVQNSSANHSANAGHTMVRPDGEAYVFKALPSAAALGWMGSEVRPRLWVGPNSGFEEAQFLKEIRDMKLRMSDVFVHHRAALVQDHHKQLEGPGGALSTLHISSTMSGAGATYASKAMRQLDTLYAGEVDSIKGVATVGRPDSFWRAIQSRLQSGESFLHEVAQGFALSLDYGNHDRHGTFRNCTAQQGAADMGILPHQIGNVYLNLRTYPIRVGNNFDADGNRVGYSGDWEADQQELDWETIGRAAGMPEEEIQALFYKEKTTVTKKLRRVASFTMTGTKFAAAFNGATHLILNFTSYVDWASTDVSGGRSAYQGLSRRLRKFVEDIEDGVGLPVVMLGTGAKHDSFILPYGDINVGSPALSRQPKQAA